MSRIGDAEKRLIKSAAKRTNYDRFTNMSMYELAFELAISGCPKIYLLDESSEVFNCPAEEDPTRGDCVKCWLEYLKREVKE